MILRLASKDGDNINYNHNYENNNINYAIWPRRIHSRPSLNINAISTVEARSNLLTSLTSKGWKAWLTIVIAASNNMKDKVRRNC